MITDRVVEKLEEGVIPWRKTWNVPAGETPKNYEGKEYRGINAFLLSVLSGFESNYFFTFNQVKKMGGTVKKGSTSFPIVFWTKSYKKKKKNEITGEQETLILTTDQPLLKKYRVFNLEQTEGIEAPEEENKNFNPTEFKAIDCAAKIVEEWKEKPSINHGAYNPSYFPESDRIRMPHPTQFENAEEYYTILFHEMTHSTGHSTRLKRREVMKQFNFGSHEYSKEELVAEFGSLFLSSQGGISEQVEGNSIAYISGWLEVLRNNKTWLLQASQKAQKATDLILG